MSTHRFHPTTAPVARPRTYAETQNAQPFDWWEFLDLADAGKIEIHSREHEIATGLAYSWTTCACGNQCSIIPRHTEAHLAGAPKDDILRGHGSHFAYHIVRGIWPAARATLRAIEARSAQLIAELSQPRP